jgi:hypothetical protein
MDETPLYPECLYCGESVLPWDDQRDTNDGALIWHAECLMRQIVGSVGHQMRRCHCYGGSEGDPPGMTRREAAKAAAELFITSKDWGNRI